MDYSSKTRSGAWVKAAELTEGLKAKIADECQPIESQFLDDKGNKKTQDVCKVRFEGKGDPVNVNLNRATIKGLVDAFGADSKLWIGDNTPGFTKRDFPIVLSPAKTEPKVDEVQPTVTPGRGDKSKKSQSK